MRPIQSNLDMSPNSEIRDGQTAYTQCVSCQMRIALFEMKQHTQVCNHGKIKQSSTHRNATSSATVTTKVNDIPKSDLIVVL